MFHQQQSTRPMMCLCLNIVVTPDHYDKSDVSTACVLFINYEKVTMIIH